MKINQIIYIALFIIILLLILFLILYLLKQEPLKDVEIKNEKHSYFRFSDDMSNNKSIVPIQTFHEIMEAEGIKEGEKTNSTIYMFETQNIVDNLIDTLKIGQYVQYIFGIKGTDKIVSKSALALHMRVKLEPHIVRSILPVTYIYGRNEDMIALYHTLKKNQGMYILKKNIQRQEGNLISQDPNTIINGATLDYIVVQKLLLNPLLINNRKINLRIYLLVCVDKDEASFYIYNDGFIYYSPEKWDKYSTNPQVHITTGYINRQIYNENPLTLKDLKDFIGDEQYSTLWGNIVDLMKHVKTTYKDIIYELNNQYNAKFVSIFGCDVAPDDTLSTKLIEINKGPDLSYKDERDKEVKYNMVYDAFNIMGILNKKTIEQTNYTTL